ncbi:MAG TPA: hypothetical protein VIM65_02460 [Cyclobacteriaceae bacterium]
MKKQTIVILFLLSLTAIVFGQHPTDDFTGKWKTEDGHVVTISKSNKVFTGVDYKNRVCLYNILFEKGVWTGTIENHDEGKKGDCEIYLHEDELKIVIHKGFFYKTLIWVKVK